MKRIKVRIKKGLQTPFYMADVVRKREQFLRPGYESVFEDASVMGLNLDVKEKVELLKEVDSVFHLHVSGIDYFYNQDIDAYWEETAQLIEERLKD